jgi:hypothetical protein
VLLTYLDPWRFSKCSRCLLVPYCLNYFRGWKISRFSRIRHRPRKFYPAKYSVSTMICGRGQPSAIACALRVECCSTCRLSLLSYVSSERGRFHVLLAILSDAVDSDIELVCYLPWTAHGSVACSHPLRSQGKVCPMTASPQGRASCWRDSFELTSHTR